MRYDIAHKLSALVDRAEATHGIITITRHGKPAAVLMSVDDLESLQETIYWLSRPGTAESVAVADREYAAGRTTSLEELRARSDTESTTPRPEEVTVLHQPR
ncbi:type II toxin-antitoxin system Phd/YefM family antitoxin [Rhodococcus sp. 14C212]|uniref:type II toxin-antitoxin system Phd/YefM family antitoxin n=1 Tax=Rhodococcus sp. 14C212 TaxID=2711209 RepID=UPI001F0D65BF|nr:type II toxin-antitoxin system Phd/YefM family antitoxin [Rhodococcus sp. 14C212]